MIFEIQKGWVERQPVQEWVVEIPTVVLKPQRIVSCPEDGHLELHDQIVIQPIDHIIRKITCE